MKKAIKNLDYPLLVTSIILTAIGLYMIFSASSIVSVLQYKRTSYFYLIAQIKAIAIGFIGSIIIININIKKYKIPALFFMLLGLLSLLALKKYGIVSNNARSWFSLGSLGNFQPSEFMKPIIILFLASFYGNRKKFAKWWYVFVPMIFCAFAVFLIMKEPDLGTALIITFMCALIFFSLPLRGEKIIIFLKILTVICVVGSAYLINSDNSILSEYQRNRLKYQEPCKRYLEDTGYQVCNGYIAMNNGGVLGVGLGSSSQKYLYLPESYTDFIFPIIVEEVGFIGGLVIIGLYVYLLFRIIYIATHASDLMGSIIAFGTFIYILLHIIVNLGGVLALIPITGVPLPFLSYGGSFMLNLMVLLALTQRVAIESKINRNRKVVV